MEENDIFAKALSFLCQKRLEQLGLTADIIITHIDASDDQKQEPKETDNCA